MFKWINSKLKQDVKDINTANQMQNETMKIMLSRIEKLEQRVDELESK